MINLFTLENGIRVITEKMPTNRTVSFGVFVNVGSVNETVENNGISHVIEHCLFKGTKKRSARELADEISAIGDQVNAYTGKEWTAFYGATLSEYLERLMELLSDMLLNSTFEDEPLKKELGVILEEIDMYDDSPEDLVHEMLEKNVWKDHPLGYIISGEKKIVKKMTRDEIKTYMDDHYYGENMVISVAGSFDEKELLNLLNKYFLPIKKKPVSKIKKEIEMPSFNRVSCERYKDVEQLYTNIAFKAFPADSEDRYAAIVTNAMLGGNNNSKLFQKIREESGLAYSVYSYQSLYSLAGLFHVDMTINPSNLMLVYEQLMEILDDFRKNARTKEEIQIVFDQLKVEIIMGNESVRNRMESNAKSVLTYGRIVNIEESIDKLSKVTADDVQRLAEHVFDKKLFSICFVGDTKNSASQIKKIKKENSF